MQMRFVDGKAHHAGVAGLELVAEARQPLGETSSRRSVPRAASAIVAACWPASSVLLRAAAAMPRFRSAGDLILHERHEWRDNERQSAADERRHLEADRLAAAGGQHGKHVMPTEHGGDDARLHRAEVGIAEGTAQDVAGDGWGRDHAEERQGRGGHAGENTARRTCYRTLTARRIADRFAGE